MREILNILGAATDSIKDSLSSAGESPSDVGDVMQPLIMTVTFLIGGVSAIMIIVGGVQYTTSQGDPGKVKKAKDTIMYGIIGLVIALAAFAIAWFVTDAIN